MHKDAIRIAEPCHADWRSMTARDKGRFCGECKKHVHELARLSEAEATALLATPSVEGLCVRYVHDELGRVLFRDTFAPRPVPAGALVRAKRALQTAALALPLSLTACMGAAPRPEPVMGAPMEVPTAPSAVDAGAPGADASAQTAPAPSGQATIASPAPAPADAGALPVAR